MARPASKRAPIEPMAAASVGVAAPIRIEPRTSTIRHAGGSRIWSTRARRSTPSWVGTGGQAFGRVNATNMIQAMYSPTRTIPGRNAPAKRSMTETGSGAKLPSPSCAWVLAPCMMSPRITSTMDGGMIWPSVPEAQITPQASFGS